MNAAVHIDTTETIRYLTKIERDQLPYVLAKTVTDVAKGAQAEIQKAMPRRFNIRNPWAIKGVRIEPGKKADVKRTGQAEAAVTHIDPFMEKQETGAQRAIRSQGRATGGNKRQAVPVDDTGLRTASGAIKKAKRPGALLKDYGKLPDRRTGRKWGRKRRPKPFIMAAKNGASLVAIRTGAARNPVRVLFTLTSRIKVNPRFEFRTTVENYAATHFYKIFKKNMAEALADVKKV
jgi:hypothetical protein